MIDMKVTHTFVHTMGTRIVLHTLVILVLDKVNDHLSWPIVCIWGTCSTRDVE